MQIFLTFMIDRNKIPLIRPPKFSKKEKILCNALMEVINESMPMNSESIFKVAGKEAMIEFIDYVNDLDYLRIKSKYPPMEDRYLDE